jgi:hypothetical protein
LGDILPTFAGKELSRAVPARLEKLTAGLFGDEVTQRPAKTAPATFAARLTAKAKARARR